MKISVRLSSFLDILTFVVGILTQVFKSVVMGTILYDYRDKSIVMRHLEFSDNQGFDAKIKKRVLEIQSSFFTKLVITALETITKEVRFVAMVKYELENRNQSLTSPFENFGVSGFSCRN